jgi:DNA processing protein
VYDLTQLTPFDARYPSRLRALFDPPDLTVSGGPIEGTRVVAIVGARHAHPDAVRFAGQLAQRLAGLGVVVASGGAAGVDAAAHLGALTTQLGRTWVVAPTGHRHCYPIHHAALFERVSQGPGAVVWPFSPGSPALRHSFLRRNRVLVALSDAVVVVQAGPKSGSLNTAGWARALGRPLWAVPAPPWLEGFDGSRDLIALGARPLTSTTAFLVQLGLIPPVPSGENRRAPGLRPALTDEPQGSLLLAPLSGHESAVLAATSGAPCHIDAIASVAGVSPQATTAALLTLALENVVVEGPPGFYRRRDHTQ